jgi:hypothetical protein
LCHAGARAALFNPSLKTEIEYDAMHFKFVLRNGTVESMSGIGVRRRRHPTTTDHFLAQPLKKGGMSDSIAEPSPPELRHRISAGFIGNVVEWYDFALYGYLAGIIAPIFFPEHDPTAGLIATYGIFAAGFIMRPIGAAVFGWFGDLYGRAHTMQISVALMALPTLLLGLLPSYEMVGILAPALLVLVRVLQGLSVDQPLPDVPESNQSKSGRERAIALARREKLTVRQLAQRVGGYGGLSILGTPKTIADEMEDWLTSGACDGFTVMFPYLPTGLDDFVEKVVPELQRRGLLRRRYEGTTLRDHLGLPRPGNQFFD